MIPGIRHNLRAESMRDRASLNGRGATPVREPLDLLKPLRWTWRMLLRLPWRRLMLWGGLCSLVWMVVWGTQQAVERLDRDIRAVRVTGELRGLPRDHLETRLTPLLGRSFFATDLHAVKASIEAEAWIESAAVRREWPGRLVVDVVEQRPVAYWNDAALLNGRGDVFVPHNPEVAGNLVRLHGPEGRAHEVLTQAHWFREQLAVEGLVLARVDLESRGAWRFWLDSGIEVALGRDHLEARFARFRKVYRTGLATQMDQVVRIDARYSNGVAVQWKDSLVPVQSAP